MTSDPIEAYLQHLQIEKGLMSGSLGTYGVTLRTLAVNLNRPLDQLTVEDVRQYLYQPAQVRKAPATKAREYTILKSFFKWLCDNRAMDPSVRERHAGIIGYLQKLRAPREYRLPETLTPAEIDNIRKILCHRVGHGSHTARRRATRDLAVFEVLLGTGIRRGELVNLRISDLVEKGDPQRGKTELWLKVVAGKGNKQRWLPLSHNTIEALNRYLASRNSKSERLFDLSARGVFAVIARCLTLGGLPKSKRLGPHSLRHTFATLLVRQGAQLPAVQRLLGHSSLSTTSGYTHVSPHDLRETVERCQI